MLITKTNHTPGPWHVGYSHNQEKSIFNESSSACVCIVEPLLNQKETEANAKLIAAAPELLEILQNIMEYAEITDLPKSIKSFLIGETAEAIKKATE